MGMKKPGDWVLLGFTVAATIPFIVANLVILIFRRRKYFLAQGGVDLIVTGSLAGLIWIFSSFIVNDHLQHRTAFLRHCSLWNLLLRTSLGFCLWLVCITLRLHRMYLLTKYRNGVSWANNLLVPLLVLPAIAMSIAAGRFHAFERREDGCQMKRPWLFGVFFTVVPTYFSGVLVFLFLMRGNRDPVVRSEFTHTSECTLMAGLIYLLAASVFLTKGYTHVEGRCFLTFCVCFLVFFHFWVRMAWPVYLCMFRPKSEMDAFEETLRRSGAGIFRVSSAVHSVPDEVISSEGAVWHALQQATEEVLRLKLKMRDLETEKKNLLHQLQLRRELAPNVSYD